MYVAVKGGETAIAHSLELGNHVERGHHPPDLAGIATRQASSNLLFDLVAEAVDLEIFSYHLVGQHQVMPL